MTVADGDRVLVKNQSAAADNGVYAASTSAWERAKDFDGGLDVVTGTLVFITSGTVSGGKFYKVTTTGDITVGTTGLAFDSTTIVSTESGLSTGSAFSGGAGNGVSTANKGNGVYAGDGNNITSTGQENVIQGGDGNQITGAASRAAVVGGVSNTASATEAFIGGGDGNTVTGTEAGIVGGNSNTASATDAFIGGGNTNSVTAARGAIIGGLANTVQTGANAGIVAGEDNVASGSRSFIGGGSTNAASATNAAVLAGEDNAASALNSAVLAGSDNTASGSRSAVLAGQFNQASGAGAVATGNSANASKDGQFAHSAGGFAAVGDAQSSRMVVRNVTTNSSQTELYIDGSAATKRMSIVSDTAWAFNILLVARRTDADNESAAYQILGCIDNNAGTTALVGTITKSVIAEDNAGWDVTAEADNTNDALVVKVTGENSKTIRWVASVWLTEVTG